MPTARDETGPDGRDDGFAEFVEARYAQLTRTAYLLTRNHHAAEDLVQSALARTLLSWSRVARADAIDAYVRRIMVNEHLGWWRRAWRHREVSTAAVPESAGPPPAGHDVELWDAIGRLPPKLRAVIILRYYEDLTEAEIAAALNCSVGAIKSRARRAIAQLRTAWCPDPASASPVSRTSRTSPAGTAGTAGTAGIAEAAEES